MSLKYSTLRPFIGYYLGYTATSGNWTSERQRVIQDCLDGGLRQVYTPPRLPEEKKAYRWSFLELTEVLATTAPHTTGTITVVDGVVTFTSATVPSWAAQGDLIVDSVAYSVNTRDSSSQVTLDDLTLDVAAGTSYELARMGYTMPDNFGGMVGNLTYRPQHGKWISIPRVSEEQIRSARAAGYKTGIPQCCAVRPLNPIATATGQRWELLLWPMADDAYQLDYKFLISQDALASDTYPAGGVWMAELIKASCLSYAEQQYCDGKTDNIPNLKKNEFIERLRAAIDFDRQGPNKADFIGVMPETEAHESSVNWGAYHNHRVRFNNDSP